MRFGGGGGAGGWAAWAARWRRRPSCSRRSTPCRPPTPTRRSMPSTEASPVARFRFLAFLQRYRGWLVGRHVARRARCRVHARGPDARPLRHRQRCIETGPDARCGRRRSRSSLIILFDWWVMWAEARVMGRTSERLLHALRIKVFAHLQRLGVDYYEHEMAGRIMTRMTTDIDALSQLLQNGLVNALVNLVTFLGVGIALMFMDPRARAGDGAHPAAADHRDDLVPIRVQQGVRGGARAHRRGQREPARGPLGRPGLAGVRPRGAQPGAVRGGRGRLPRRPRRTRSDWSRSTSRSSTSCPTSRSAWCSAPARCSWPTDRSRSARSSLSCCTSTCSSRRSSSSRRCSTPTSRRRWRSIGSPSSSTAETSVPAPAEPVPVPQLRGEVALEDVHFRYAKAVDEALRGVDVHVAPGETVALVGETGAGSRP